MKRRDFLRSSGWFVVGAALTKLPGCGDDEKPGDQPGDDPEGTYQFPQGLASGDPRQTSVVLWTRVVRGDSDTSVDLRVQASTDSNFGSLAVDEPLTATADSDHTVRVLVTGLTAGTTYYYRFVAGKDSIPGRTRTAPAADADVQVNLAWVSCQDYTSGHYGAYRQMLVDDAARATDDQIHAVVHLGDMIYETVNSQFQQPLDDKFAVTTVTNRDGSPRKIADLPSGTVAAGVQIAVTVDDYRHLYRTFLSDPDLQAARARWPFISIWDDHEFTNDCWQSQANYLETQTNDEPSQRRRVAASQAWFEYTPAHLTGAAGVDGVPSQAKDFAATTVNDVTFPAPNDDNFVNEPNNAAAVGAITIFRSLRFGQHVELVMTDQRSYRSDHAIPEDLVEALKPTGIFVDTRNVLPLDLVKLLDLGKFSGMDTIPGFGVPNPRANSPIGTMLGKPQKAWWKDTMAKSTATWKLWGNEVPLTRVKINTTAAVNLGFDRVLDGDGWDGYPTERAELMTYLRTQGIDNVVVLTGDIHAAFAGTISDDFDLGAAAQTVACELIAPGITSNSLLSFFEFATRGQALHPVIVGADGNAPVDNLNTLLLHGSNAAANIARGGDVGQSTLPPISDPQNPHLKYVDTNAQGYGYLKATGAKIDASIVVINRPIGTPSDAGPGIKRTASFSIPKDNPGGMTGPTFTGTKPFPVT